MTIPNSGQPMPPTPENFRYVVRAYEGSTSGDDKDRLTNTKRMARWSGRLALHLSRAADEIERLNLQIKKLGG